MKISSIKLKNYRRLADIDLVLGQKKTIMVGANNSGKTSCIGALHTFLVRPENLRIRDVSKHNWKEVSAIGTEFEKSELNSEKLGELAEKLARLLPSLDVQINAEAHEAYIVRDILPHLDWNGGALAVRITYQAENIDELLRDYTIARNAVSGHDEVSLWPNNLFDFLEKGKNFSKYFRQQYYILSLDDDESNKPRLQPLKSTALRKLVRVDVISEQRGLGQEDGSDSKGPFSEKQRLNKLLRDYYDRFLNPEDFPEAGDLEVLKEQQKMESGFSERLHEQFKASLDELEEMGYPGIGGNPRVEIVANISGADALQKSSSVHYRFNQDNEDTLPESYLGLGYQNLIYLTFRLLGFRDRWMRKGKSLSSDDELAEQIEPIHLVLVEEPEVNLHAQVQRVFVAKAYETLRKHENLGEKKEYQTQLLISTHSSHIVNGVDFKDLRYFRRSAGSEIVKMDYSTVENMSELFDKPKTELKFVSKHLKLTHCDIFFADGVIFVEGQAERLLVPEFINEKFMGLSKRYLSILEVSGAHTHKYKDLIEKLGIVTLIITDLDSVDAAGKKCAPLRNKGQKTGNHTLKSWHPKKENIDELVGPVKDAKETEVQVGKENSPVDKSSTSGKNSSKEHSGTEVPSPPLFVAYQKPVSINGKEVLSRTFEDALILANFESKYFQAMSALSKAKSDSASGKKQLADSLFDFVQSLRKGDFAFNCLIHLVEKDANSFIPPEYICEGLNWLEKQLTPSN